MVDITQEESHKVLGPLDVSVSRLEIKLTRRIVEVPYDCTYLADSLSYMIGNYKEYSNRPVSEKRDRIAIVRQLRDALLANLPQ